MWLVYVCALVVYATTPMPAIPPPIPSWTLPTVDGTTGTTRNQATNPPAVAQPFFSNYASPFNGPPTALNMMLGATGSQAQLFGTPYAGPQAPPRVVNPDGTLGPQMPSPGPMFGPPGVIPSGFVQPPSGISFSVPGTLDSMMSPTLDLLPHGVPPLQDYGGIPPWSYNKDGSYLSPYATSSSYPSGPFTNIPADGTYIIAGVMSNKWEPLAPSPTPFGGELLETSSRVPDFPSIQEVAEMFGVKAHHLNALTPIPLLLFSADEERILRQCQQSL